MHSGTLPAISLLAAALDALAELFVISGRVDAFILITTTDRTSVRALIGCKFIAASISALFGVPVRWRPIVAIDIFVITPVIVVLLVVAASLVLLAALAWTSLTSIGVRMVTIRLAERFVGG